MDRNMCIFIPPPMTHLLRGENVSILETIRLVFLKCMLCVYVCTHVYMDVCVNTAHGVLFVVLPARDHDTQTDHPSTCFLTYWSCRVLGVAARSSTRSF